MGLEAAVAAACQLKEVLLREIARARNERVLLRALDGAGLLESARVREEFNSNSSDLLRELARALSQAGTELGVAPVTIAGLVAAAPGGGALLDEVIAEIKALAAALAELDALNRKLAERSLTCLRAYQARVLPRATAYDRRGARPVIETTSASREA